MAKIVLISCSSKKRPEESEEFEAQDLYTSTLFKTSLQYAKLLNPKTIFILSACHYLLDLNKRITPYNVTLKEKTKKEKTEWGKKVFDQLDNKTDIKNDTFIILAGNEYIKPIEAAGLKLIKPLQGKRIGERIKFMAG